MSRPSGGTSLEHEPGCSRGPIAGRRSGTGMARPVRGGLEGAGAMRLAISNLAWPGEADESAAAVLVDCGAQGVEIAPTKVWTRPLEATASERRAYRAAWERRGIQVVALQALLFGRPELT